MRHQLASAFGTVSSAPQGDSLNSKSRCGGSGLCIEMDSLVVEHEPGGVDPNLFAQIEDSILTCHCPSLSPCPSLPSISKENEYPLPSFKEQLAAWAINNSVPHAHVNELLKILCPHHPELPHDARTLLKTPRSCKYLVIENGKYAHFNVHSSIQKKLEMGTRQDTACLSLSVNVDGISFSKSTSVDCWPILGIVNEAVDRSPFIWGVFVGNGKPKPTDEFLKAFIADCKELFEHGITVGGKFYEVKLSYIVCDAPARAYLKAIVQHGGYFACERCEVEGEYLNGKIVYQELNAVLRTDSSFRHQRNPEHHHGISPLVNLPIDMVQSFPLEYMHLICLGVVRRLIMEWLQGAFDVRLSAHKVTQISGHLSRLAKHTPKDFSRLPRALSEVKKWKATEFRQFLLYFGPVVLKGVLHEEVYEHFLSLHAAVSMLISPNHWKRMIYVARDLLIKFVKDAKDVYGHSILTYNMHCLIHVADDVDSFGSLDKYSSFPFESYLGRVKKLLRSCHLPLEQLAHRITENFEVPPSTDVKPKTCCSIQHHSGPFPENFTGTCDQFKKLKTSNFSLSVKPGDNACRLKDGKIVVIENILKESESVKIVGKCFQKAIEFYERPCLSTELGIFKVSRLSNSCYAWAISCVSEKYIFLPSHKGKVVAIPLRHHM